MNKYLLRNNAIYLIIYDFDNANSNKPNLINSTDLNDNGLNITLHK